MQPAVQELEGLGLVLLLGEGGGQVQQRPQVAPAPLGEQLGRGHSPPVMAMIPTAFAIARGGMVAPYERCRNSWAPNTRMLTTVTAIPGAHPRDDRRLEREQRVEVERLPVLLGGERRADQVDGDDVRGEEQERPLADRRERQVRPEGEPLGDRRARGERDGGDHEDRARQLRAGRQDDGDRGPREPEPEHGALEAQQLVGLADGRPLVDDRRGSVRGCHVRVHRTRLIRRGQHPGSRRWGRYRAHGPRGAGNAGVETRMIRTTPFHERTSALNETGLWSHWAGRLAAEKYQLSEKFEYFAVRNAAGIFDTSPLFKYRFSGPGAEAYLASVLARDPRTLKPGEAQYAIWCDDAGFVVEDGVLLRHAEDEFVLTAAEPNLAWFTDLVRPRDQVVIEDVSDDWAVLSIQGRARCGCWPASTAAIEQLAYFGHREAKIAGRKVRVSRTGYTGDLGYEVWCRAEDALTVWDAVWKAADGLGVLPFGMQALYMTRIEAGLLLLDVDFASSRFAWTDADRATPHELGLGWMLRGHRRGRAPVRRPRRDPARAGGRDVALPDHRVRRRLARLEPPPRRGRPDPADGPHAGPGGDVPVRRRGRADRVSP